TCCPAVHAPLGLHIGPGQVPVYVTGVTLGPEKQRRTGTSLGTPLQFSSTVLHCSTCAAPGLHEMAPAVQWSVPNAHTPIAMALHMPPPPGSPSSTVPSQSSSRPLHLVEGSGPVGGPASGSTWFTQAALSHAPATQLCTSRRHTPRGVQLGPGQP